MAEQLTEDILNSLLEDLKSGHGYRRETAVEKLVKLKANDERVISALEQIAANDPNRWIRQSAKKALKSLEPLPPVEILPPAPPPPASETPPDLSTPAKPSQQLSRNEKIRVALGLRPTPKQELSRNEKIRDFLIGFIGWWVISSALLGGMSILINLLLFPLTIVAMIILAFIWRWGALGILTAVGLNFLISIIAGLSTNATCFIPFYFR